MERMTEKLAWNRRDCPIGWATDIQWQANAEFARKLGLSSRNPDAKGTLGTAWIWASGAILALISTGSLWI